ncbi:MAG: tetraacyldisaccharide 4'-kinase [Cytophagaceae bacterium]|jgi:tetraacyldisaccharide 4'-kinase|nr:tetraacyldisaccharide 4'-kinase [Cytophagaceae bacterium]
MKRSILGDSMKYLLFPFSLLYSFITSIRNECFNRQWKKSVSFNIPIISIGNLKVGGTGKTPHTEYLARLLMPQYFIGILSRGYGRKTKGFVLADKSCSAATIGDEPYQYFWKWSQHIRVAVSEKRVVGVRHLLALPQPPTLILLDDAFQHRHIKPGLQILLTEYSQPFYLDFVLPMGRLRESRSGASRADLIVITKCPSGLSSQNAEMIRQQVIKYAPSSEVFFSYIKYGEIQSMFSHDLLPTRNPSASVLLVTGIASGSLVYKELIDQGFRVFRHLEYSDHHSYTKAEVEFILELIERENLLLITTEKDAVKLKDILPSTVKAYFMPIEIDILYDKELFNNRIVQFASQKH